MQATTMQATTIQAIPIPGCTTLLFTSLQDAPFFFSLQDAQQFFSQLHRFISALEAASQEVAGGRGPREGTVQKRAWIESQITEESSFDAGAGMIDKMMQSVIPSRLDPHRHHRPLCCQIGNFF